MVGCETERVVEDGAPGKRGGAPHFQPELDGIRGLAILAVLLSHAADLLHVLPYLRPHSGWVDRLRELLVPGWGGVDLFFALSGFLITGILLRARGGPDYFRNFYARRVLRIFPIYYLFLTCSLIGSFFWPGLAENLPYGKLQIFSFFIYLQNWPVFWKDMLGLTGLWGVYWSLAVEEQFYLIWPAMVSRVRAEWLLGLCLAGFVAGPFIRGALGYHLTGWTLGLLDFPVARLDGLFLGAAIALYREARGKLIPLPLALTCFWGGVIGFGWIALIYRDELISTGKYMSIYGISVFALISFGLLAASQHDIPWLRGLLSVKPLRFFGKYSYGMYVYHLAVYAAVVWLARTISPATRGELPFLPALGMMVLAMGLTCGVAVLSFTFFEEPILRLKRFFPSAARPAQISVGSMG